jgi:predicted nucleic acid-binding protein
VTIVADASTVVAALVDGGDGGTWAADLLAREPITAPHHMPIEVANILRRAALSGEISEDTASLAHSDLRELRTRLYPYDAVADRAWELRQNITAYDACYVALAEGLGVPFATLDRRLARANGTRCEFLLP